MLCRVKAIAIVYVATYRPIISSIIRNARLLILCAERVAMLEN